MVRNFFSCFIILLGLTLVYCHQGFSSSAGVTKEVDRIVAVVNDEIILYSELRKKVDKLKSRLKGSFSEGLLEKQVLEQMIQEKLVEQEMKRLRIVVNEQKVNAFIESIKNEQNLTDEQFMRKLQQEGISLDEFKEDIKKEIVRATLIEKVFQSKTVITDADVERYISSHPERVITKVKLSAIYLPQDEKSISAEEILKKIKAGADFSELARKYSKGLNAQEGGNLGWINIDELAEDLKRVVASMSPGDVSSPIYTGKGNLIIKLEDKVSERIQLSITNPKDKEKVRRFLFQQEVDRKFREWMGELMKKAYIRISL